jgi:exonuclease III
MGAGVAFLVKEAWQKHIIRKNTYKGRGISLDFGYHSGTLFRVVNCYVPASRDSEGKKEFQELAEWVKRRSKKGKKKAWRPSYAGILMV